MWLSCVWEGIGHKVQQAKSIARVACFVGCGLLCCTLAQLFLERCRDFCGASAECALGLQGPVKQCFGRWWCAGHRQHYPLSSWRAGPLQGDPGDAWWHAVLWVPWGCVHLGSGRGRRLGAALLVPSRLLLQLRRQSARGQHWPERPGLLGWWPDGWWVLPHLCDLCYLRCDHQNPLRGWTLIE